VLRRFITDNLQTRAAFVDTTDPAMSALSGPEAAVSGPAAFSFSAAADSTFRRFECRVPGLRDAWTTCSTGIQEDPPSGTWQFEVRAVDWSNNRSPASSWAWEVDKQEPDTTLTGGPSGAVASSAATFTFDSSEPSGDFLCRLDGGVQEPCEPGA
jgi:hypothetical protein